MLGRPPGPLALTGDPIAAFVAENKVDKVAEEALRGLPPELLRRVLADGPVTGPNPSAAVMGRIRALEQNNGVSNGIMLALTDGTAPPGGNGIAVGAKLLPRAPGPSSTTAQPKQQGCAAASAAAAVPGTCPKSDTTGSAWGEPVGSGWGDPVPSRQDTNQQGQQQAPQMQPPQQQQPVQAPQMQPPSHPHPSQSAQGQQKQQQQQIEMFCRQHGIDAGAERVLRQLSPQAQHRVLEEGPVGGSGANPSLELMNRIHRTEAWDHDVQVSSFLTHNFVDSTAQNALRQLPMESQRNVMGLGPLLTTDRSQELLARIKNLGNRGREGTEGNASDPVGQFSSENVIDAGAEAALRALPADLQQKVLEEGPVRQTMNPSAVLMSRIRRVKTPGSGDAPRSRSRSRSQSRPAGSQEEKTQTPNAAVPPAQT